jgi:hypothetical protein
VGSARPQARRARSFLGDGALGACALVAVGLLAWRFMADPSRLAVTRDPAWYTWRTQALLHARPELLILKQGPFSMLSGGYRVTTPVLGGLLHRVAGVSTYRFTILLEVGLPVLASLCLAAFAYRHRRDRLRFALVLGASVALFLTTSFIGYMDEVASLFLLAAALPFLEPARTSWGARTALVLLMFLATLTHPTTSAVFALVLAAGGGVTWLAERFSLRRTLSADGPALASAGVGFLAGFLFWRLGLWGVGAGFSDSVLTQPYPKSTFLARLHAWVESLHPPVIVPLAALGLGWVVWTLVRRKDREPLGWHHRMSVLWLLPLLGALGFLFGLVYPYYRFLNTTVAPLLLVGTGLWLIARGGTWLGARLGGRPVVAWAGTIAGVGVAVLMLVVGLLRPGIRSWDRQGAWIGRKVLVSETAASAYARAEPGRPIVFVIHPNDRTVRAWGLAKQSSNFLMAGVSGDQVERTFVYVGDPDRFLARQPTVTGHPVFDRLSRGFLADLEAGLGRFDAEPVAFVIGQFNHGVPESVRAGGTEVTPSVFVLNGPGLAPPSEQAAAAGRRAADELSRNLSSPHPRFERPGHLLRVVFGLFLLAVLPGLLAMRWFEIRGFAEWMALVPALSLALSEVSAVAVVAVHRAPFAPGDGWASAALAVALGAGLGLLARRRSRAPALSSSERPGT